MMLRHVLLILLFVSCTALRAQQEPPCIRRTFTPEQLKQDLDYLGHYLPKFHPDPYRFVSRDSLARFVELQKSRVDTAMTERQFRVLVKQIVALIGCGHTDVDASKTYTKAVKDVVRPLLPVNVYIDDSLRLFVLNNLSEDRNIFTGDEILQIDGRPVPDVLAKMFSTYSSDGYITTSKRQGMRYDWFK
jgi:hypothetical protein